MYTKMKHKTERLRTPYHGEAKIIDPKSSKGYIGGNRKGAKKPIKKKGRNQTMLNDDLRSELVITPFHLRNFR